MRVRATLGRLLPERRLFLRSEDRTRFVRLGPGAQFAAASGLALVVGWSGVASVLVLLDSVGGGNVRALAERDRFVYEDRVNALSAERDLRQAEAVAARDGAAAALGHLSALQGDLLRAETRRLELEQDLAAAQAVLRDAMDRRDAARAELAALATSQGEDAKALNGVLAVMTRTLEETAAERDRVAAEAEEAVQLAGDLDVRLRLMEEDTAEVLARVEDALAVSVAPLDEVFRSVGLDPEDLVAEAAEDHAPVMIQVSTMGAAAADDPTLRANRILDQLDDLANYAEAVEGVPLAMPVQAAFRYTSPFGPRWGRMHEGVDMAGPVGTPVYATADGVVTFAGWQNGYGRIVIVRHAYGVETRYPHLNAIRAEVGQRVEVGEQVGDMGNSGRSTGPHLHYEVRVDGEAVDPMTFIRAGQAL